MAAPKGDSSFAKLPPAGKAGIGLGLVAVMSAGYYFVVHLRLDEDLTRARVAQAQLVQQMNQAREQNAEYYRLREQLSAREERDEANRSALPTSAETATFLGDLNRLAELSGLTMRLVEPRPEEPEEHYVRLPVNLRITGRYHQLARFFDNVSRLPRLISMENIHLSNPRLNDAGEVIVDVEVLATTFRRGGDEDEAQAAAGGTGATGT